MLRTKLDSRTLGRVAACLAVIIGASGVTSGQASGRAKKSPPKASQRAKSATADSAAAQVEAASLAAEQADKEAAAAKMQLYWQFIVAMLTNQGPMPLGRISMMLGIVVPGGFPFSNEELKEFLGRMVSEGRVEVGAGGTYRVVHQ